METFFLSIIFFHFTALESHSWQSKRKFLESVHGKSANENLLEWNHLVAQKKSSRLVTLSDKLQKVHLWLHLEIN